MEFESLIFDIDGTLWDSRALVAEGYNIQLRREGLDHLCTDAETLKSLFGKVMSEIGDALFASIPVPERYYGVVSDGFRCKVGVRPMDLLVGGADSKGTPERIATFENLGDSF